MKKLAYLALGGTLALGALAATVVPALAEHGPGGPHDRHMRGGPPLAEVLDLSDSQKMAVDKLHDDLMEQARPLIDQHRGQMEAIHAALDQANADPTDIGRKMIAAHATGKQIEALHKDCETKVRALLTPEQQQKFDLLHSLRESMHQGGPDFGFGPPPEMP
ncbi:MAG: Spy/CpxP family protein refolding chaperone [Thermoanaerobaculia bacterium]